MQQKKIFTVLAIISLIFILAGSAFLFLRINAIFSVLSDNPIFAEDVSFSKYPILIGLGIIMAFSFFLFIVFLAKPSEVKAKVVSGQTEGLQAEDIEIEEEENEEDAEELRIDEEKAKLELEISIGNHHRALLKNLENEKTIQSLAEKFLRNAAKEMQIVQGLFFERGFESDKFQMTASYAFYSEEGAHEFELGEGLAGQVAQNRQLLNIANIPEGYIMVYSGLGQSSPRHLVIMPIVFNNETYALAEIASFKVFDEAFEKALERAGHSIGELIANLK
jgi:hypothetical protein